jgi:hypothetical protein
LVAQSGLVGSNTNSKFEFLETEGDRCVLVSGYSIVQYSSTYVDHCDSGDRRYVTRAQAKLLWTLTLKARPSPVDASVSPNKKGPSIEQLCVLGLFISIKIEALASKAHNKIRSVQPIFLAKN